MDYQEKIEITATDIKACTFTGHRTLGADFNPRNLVEYIQALIDKGVTHFYNGMARGFDLISAEAVLMFKHKNPQIKLIACVPHVGQEYYFDDEEKARYYAVLKKADETVVLADRYYRGCMQKRNQYMVDKSDLVLAIWNGENKGGTWDGTAKNLRYGWSPVFCFDDGSVAAAQLCQMGANLVRLQDIFQLDTLSDKEQNLFDQ